jgi:hypothetical protein
MLQQLVAVADHALPCCNLINISMTWTIKESTTSDKVTDYERLIHAELQSELAAACACSNTDQVAWMMLLSHSSLRAELVHIQTYNCFYSDPLVN